MGDVFDAVGAQDVDGEAAEPGEVHRLDPGSAVVFTERDVANVMASIFDRPVAADGMAERLGAKGNLADVEGDLIRRVPQSRLGVLVPGQASDAGSAPNQVVPLGGECAGDVEDLDQTVLLAAVAVAINGFKAVGCALDGGDGMTVAAMA